MGLSLLSGNVCAKERVCPTFIFASLEIEMLGFKKECCPHVCLRCCIFAAIVRSVLLKQFLVGVFVLPNGVLY